MKKALIIASIFLIVISGYFFNNKSDPSGFDFDSLKRLPVQHQGRLKPLDSVARTSLLILRENQSLTHEGRSLSPIEWLATLTMDAQKGDTLKMIRIDNPDVLALINKQAEDGKYYSYGELEKHLDTIQKQAQKASTVEEVDRDSYQNALVNLWEKLLVASGLRHSLYAASAEKPLDEYLEFHKDVNELRPFLKNKQEAEKLDFHKQMLLQWYVERYQFMDRAAQFEVLCPTSSKTPWSNMGEGLLAKISHAQDHPGLLPMVNMIDAFRKGDGPSFNNYLGQYSATIDKHLPEAKFITQVEIAFNQLQPFTLGITLYILSFLSFMISFLTWEGPLKKISFSLIIAAFIIHTAGLLCRMYIEGRPPVTNLYSSAVFVGWGAVFLGCILERLYRNGIGSCVASITGSLSLIVAHHLMNKGDTMEMMRAVLNSNFWLSTHVVTISMGYSSALLAGFLACAYVIRGLFSQADKQTQRSIYSMVYGIICFSTFFSFVGTILGGIWADQSWGRFWGWDPKENGALMIVLWNAIILHARWGALVKVQGFMYLAIFGNVICSFSWFGVNMLGVGLHSYGFMQSAFFWLCTFMLSQIAVILMGVTRNKIRL